MTEDERRKRRMRTEQLSSAVLIIVLIIGAVLRAQGESGGLVVIEIAAALLIVVIILFFFRRFLRSSGSALDDIRKNASTAYNCYYEGGKRGIVFQRDGELHLLRAKRSNVEEYLTLPAGSYALSPAEVAITAVRRAAGIRVTAVDEPDGAGVRLALCRDEMTLTGSMLTGQELHDAATLLQRAAQR